MQNKFIAGVLGNKKIYPVTVREMVEILKALIDEYRQQCYKSNNEKVLLVITRQIKIYKNREPKLFAQSRRYLRTKRKILLKVILTAKFLNN